MVTVSEEQRRLTRDLTRGKITKKDFDAGLEKLKNKPVLWTDYTIDLYKVKNG